MNGMPVKVSTMKVSLSILEEQSHTFFRSVAYESGPPHQALGSTRQHGVPLQWGFGLIPHLLEGINDVGLGIPAQ